MTWILIFAMGAIVFLNRYAFLEPRLPLRLSSNARQFLGFAVPGMLTAICGPIIFMPDHQLNLSLLNPYLLGSLVAIALVLLTRSVLLSMLVSMLIFFLLRSWLALTRPCASRHTSGRRRPWATSRYCTRAISSSALPRMCTKAMCSP